MTESQPQAPLSEPAPRKRVNLALQGGGSHGAFSWGVLDALLEDGRIEVEAISGTSAGAMNAVVLASGLAKGGVAGARAALADFWHRLGVLGHSSPFRRSWWSRLTGKWRIDDSPGYALASISNLFLSPYQTNPFGLNPLRGLLKDVVDFDAVRRDGGIKLFLSATDVETGKNRLFRTKEVCVEAVLASACLPQLFQAVRYQDRHYWDGGYMGNPALWPLFYECGSRDVVLVAINPLNRPGVPMTPFEIMDRVNEITFNSSLMREMRAVQFVTRLIESGKLDANEYKHVLMHRISGDKELADLHASSKLNAEPDFLEHLFALGRRAGHDWLATHFDDVGRRTSIDIVQDYF